MKPRILLIEHNPATRAAVTPHLSQQGYEVIEVDCGRLAVETVEIRQPGLVIQDVAVPDMDGFELASSLRAVLDSPRVPLLALSGLLSDADERRLSAVGFDDIVTKPIDLSRLTAIAQTYLPTQSSPAQRFGEGKSIVLADDDVLQLKLSAFKLQRLGFKVATAANGAQALEAAHNATPDAMVSDIMMPGMDGFRLCIEARRNPELETIPIILTSASFFDAEDVKLAREAGATACVARSPELTEVIAALRQALVGESVSLKEPSTADGEGIYRRYTERFVRQLERQVAMNADLSQRTALMATELSAMSSIAEALTDNRSLDETLEHVVATCLDAAGLSSGALVWFRANRARLSAVGAACNWPSEGLSTFFGDAEAVRQRLQLGELLVLPRDAHTAPKLDRGLRAAGSASTLVTPIARRDHLYGALIFSAPPAKTGSKNFQRFVVGVASQLAQGLALAEKGEVRDQALRRAQASEATLRGVLEGISDGVAACDATGHFVLWNRGAEAILKMGGADVGVEAWSEHYGLYEPDGVTLMASERLPLARALKGETVVGAEVFARHAAAPAGVWLDVNASPIAGPTTGAVAVFRDVTAAKVHELRLQTALTATEAGLFEFSEHDPADWYASERWAEILGYTPEQLRPHGAGMLNWVFAQIHPDDLANAREAHRCLKTGEATTLRTDFRFRHRRGHWVDVLSFAVVMRRNADGTAARLMSTLLDVSDRKKLEAQTRQSQKMEAIGQLAGGVAHDFNNLLMAMVSFTTFAYDEMEPGDPRRADLKEVLDAADRAAALTRQLLLFSRQQPAEVTSVDLNASLGRVENLLQRTLGENIQLVVSCPPQPVTVLADSGQVDQIVLNLAVNARDAMPDGGRLQISLEVIELAERRPNMELAPGRYAALTVRDTGTGIDEATLQHVFEPFFTTKGPTKGTGFGLAIAFGIATQSGGDIVVHSTLGAGTTFCVYLPVFEGPQVAKPLIAHKSARRGQETILVVEDEAALRRIAERTLGALGYSVLLADDVKPALELMRRHLGSIDLVFSDVVLTSGNGFDLADQIHELDPRVSILLTSGYPDRDLRGGNEQYEIFWKPYQPQDLARRIGDLLDTRASTVASTS